MKPVRTHVGSRTARHQGLAPRGALVPRWVLSLVVLTFSYALNPATAQTLFGSLSNFDVINDTGQPCHGFEIELDGLSPSDVVYTFGTPPGDPSPYIRYSTPEIVPITGGVVVRYASPYDPTTGWAATTPAATSPYPTTMGHQCWYGGDPVGYPTSGCEHFGVSLINNPTNTIYRWLVEGTTPGILTPLGSNVSIPAPVWNVIPQPPVPNNPPPPPVVVAVVEAPPPENEALWGEAIWEKIYVTELPEPPALEDLLLGGAAVPDPETEPAEVEWQLLQSAPVGEAGPNEISENGGEVGADKEAVSRRYEFYKYTGNYDPESHEALCDNPTRANGNCGPVVPAKSCSVSTTQACASDADCASPVCSSCVLGETCVQHCSVTTTQVCASDADCPPAPCPACAADETCLNGQCSVTATQVCVSDADCESRGEICGLSGVGDLIGAQNAAANLAADQCHEAAICDPVTGVCTRADKPNGTPCNDGDACTQTDTCQTGVCVGSNPAADNTPCDDGYVCTQNDTCQGGVCVSGSLLDDGTVCEDGNPCTQNDTCQSGLCMSGNLASDGTACDDGDACTQGDACQAGVCAPTDVVTCPAADDCHTGGTCDPATGICSATPAAPDGTACNDGDACTQTDTCQAGVCSGADPVTCTASDQCHVAGTCDPATGDCSNPPAPEGTACNDGDACTQGESCQAGVCTPTAMVHCVASDQCHVAGTCDPATGDCSNPPAPEGTACNDGDACTQGESCQAGVCSGAHPVTCTASDQCHVAGTCDPATGQCSNPPAPEGTACNDGDACTQTDTCQAGVCTGGNPDPTCASADLSLKIQGVQKQVKEKKTIEYTLRVKNNGPDAATAVMASLACVGVPYHLVEMSSDCVVTGTSVICSLGTLGPHRSVATDVTIAPDATGVLSCTASVSSATPDPVLTNQSETVETRIR